MARIIFSLYVKLRKDEVNVHDKYTEYFDRLVANQSAYAEMVGADYKIFERDEMYEKFLKTLPSHITEYDAVNYYKFYLIEKLADEYDEILYIDLDVAFNTDKDFFAEHDLSTGIHLAGRDVKERATRYLHANREFDWRDPGIKYLLCMAMSLVQFKSFDNTIYNTGVIGITSEWAKKLDYMGQLSHYLDLIEEAIEDNFYTDTITNCFTFNNEVIFSYSVFDNDIPCVNTIGPWNYHLRKQPKEDYDEAEKYIIHFIVKEFSWLFHTHQQRETTIKPKRIGRSK